jgi:hypothetical protein
VGASRGSGVQGSPCTRERFYDFEHDRAGPHTDDPDRVRVSMRVDADDVVQLICELADADLGILFALFVVALAYTICAVAVADVVARGFDVDGVFAYVITTALVYVGVWVFWWMSPWYQP